MILQIFPGHRIVVGSIFYLCMLKMLLIALSLSLRVVSWGFCSVRYRLCGQHHIHLFSRSSESQKSKISTVGPKSRCWLVHTSLEALGGSLLGPLVYNVVQVLFPD